MLKWPWPWDCRCGGRQQKWEIQCRQEIYVWNKIVLQTGWKTTSYRSSRQSTKTFPRQHLLRKGQYSRPSHSNADDDDGIHHYEENWGKSGKIEVNLLISDPPTIFWVMSQSLRQIDVTPYFLLSGSFATKKAFISFSVHLPPCTLIFPSPVPTTVIFQIRSEAQKKGWIVRSVRFC